MPWDRRGVDCECKWDSTVHGDICPEHLGGSKLIPEVTQHYRNVEEFMRGIPSQHCPYAPCIPDAVTRGLRAKLILEEALETIVALGFRARIRPADFPPMPMGEEQTIELIPHGEPNLEQIVDGCCDIKVVTTGTLIACGVPDVLFQDMVDENNLKKLREGTIREDGKLVKPPGHLPPDIAGGLRRLGYPPAPIAKVLSRSYSAVLASFTSDLNGCARCNGNHVGLVYHRFQNPVVVGDETFSYYAQCPENGQPILCKSTMIHDSETVELPDGTVKESVRPINPTPAMLEAPDDGWTCARNIASWLDGAVQQRAMRQIDEMEKRYKESVEGGGPF